VLLLGGGGGGGGGTGCPAVSARYLASTNGKHDVAWIATVVPDEWQSIAANESR